MTDTAQQATAPDPVSWQKAPPPGLLERVGRWLSRYRLQTLGLVVGAVLWEIVGRAGVSPALPPVSAVLTAGLDLWSSERFLEATRTSASSILIALPPSVVVGVMLGLLMGLFRPVEWVCSPYINLALSLPLVAIIPIILLIFGLSRTTIVVVIVLYVLPVVIVNTFIGVRSAEPDLLEMASSFNSGRWLTVKRIVLPSARPLTLAGVRIGVGRSISGGIVAEQVVGVFGVGGLVQRLGGAFAVESLYAVIIFIGAVGVASLALINRVEQRYQIERA
jgi:NitT/TauT family transport system permease protein